MNPSRPFLVLLLALVAIPPASAQCPPYGSGTVLATANPTYTVSGQTWTRAGSPYSFSTNVTNVQIAGLAIQPGTRIEAHPGLQITVVGILQATGSGSDPIVFSMAAAPASAADRWSGLVFQGPTPPSVAHVLRHARIEYCRDSGIRILDDRPVIEDCLVRDNLATNASLNGTGGGIRIVQTTPGAVVTLTDCVVADNRADSHGGGIHAILTDGGGTQPALLRLVRCAITGNAANPALADTGPGGQHLGGGLRVEGDAEIDNCTIEDNSLGVVFSQCGTTYARGGGLAWSGGPAATLAMTRTVVARNRAFVVNCHNSGGCCAFGGCPGTEASVGGGAYLEGGGGSLVDCMVVCNATDGTCNTTRVGSGVWAAAGAWTLRHCTLAGNTQDGIGVGASATAGVESSILWGNNGTGPEFAGTPAFSWSDVQHGAPPGPGNLSFDPQFVAPLAGPSCRASGYAIAPFSPCVDAANPADPDACLPPGLGSAAGDMGAHGGGSNGGFASPAHTVSGVNVHGSSTGGGNQLTLEWISAAGCAASTGTILASGAGASAPGLFALSTAGARVPIAAAGNVTLLVDIASPGLLVVPVQFDGSGRLAIAASLSAPYAIGFPVFAQVAEFSCATPRLSNGLEFLPGP